MRGYLLGGLAWFSVPFCFATTLGMVALALRHDPDYPTYPELLTSAQVGAGLPAPAAAYALLGQGGAVAMLIVLFMAVTSALSSVYTICFVACDDEKKELTRNRN